MDEGKKYKLEKIKSMSDLEALILLYDELLTALEQARDAHAAGEKDTFREKSKWARKIIEALMSILNFEVEPNLAGNLHQIYLTMTHRLQAAENDIRQTPEILEQCIRQITSLRESWVQVRDKGDITEPFKLHLTSQDGNFLNIEI